MAAKSFYGRKLPEILVDYRSNESKLRVVRCITNGTAVPFLSLSSCFNTQTEPAYCGLSTLAIILNALRIDPQRLWKTPWRWFTEDLLDCCRPLEVVKKVGITLEEFQCLAQCNGAVCKVTRPKDDDADYELFRKAVYCACTGGKEFGVEDRENDVDQENPSTFIGISYDRKTLKQTGSGHFSPIAAYDEETDSVLVLDTARFKYPPYWVPLKLAFQSMVPIDADTGKSRGYFLLSAQNQFQGRRVCCVWMELQNDVKDQEGLTVPHPAYNINACCPKSCIST
jgi:glutathione gamma-glutamylcysteinyltransferase